MVHQMHDVVYASVRLQHEDTWLLISRELVMLLQMIMLNLSARGALNGRLGNDDAWLVWACICAKRIWPLVPEARGSWFAVCWVAGLSQSDFLELLDKRLFSDIGKKAGMG
jgi:hypothetical protein